MRQLRSDEARRDWRDLLDEVQANPDAAVQILRYDKPVAVLVSARWYDATMEFIGAGDGAENAEDAEGDQ